MIEKGASAQDWTVIWPTCLICKQTLEAEGMRFGISCAWGHGTDSLWLQGSDPRDADFGMKIPGVILQKGREGWEDVVNYLRQLGGGAERNNIVRIDIVGTERAGKTSLRKAFKSTDGKTERINFHNRTVGIEEDELQLGNVHVRMWDMAGQEVYRGLHSAFITQR